MRGVSSARGSPMLTQNLHSRTAASMASWMTPRSRRAPGRSTSTAMLCCRMKASSDGSSSSARSTSEKAEACLPVSFRSATLRMSSSDTVDPSRPMFGSVRWFPGLKVASGSSHHVSVACVPFGAALRRASARIAPLTASVESSSHIFSRIRVATCCRAGRWSCGISASFRSVTSAWMPTQNQRSSLVRGSVATTRPRRSMRLRKSSPVFLRFTMTRVKGSPVSVAYLRSERSSSSRKQLRLSTRQFLPTISFLG
mmetsp:Transcript_21487/g.62209  ORF Transcript_21487/g.62209 Transcript_21487/m.62209 type:complete len:255 (-) Transcript_21487:247-1011(-)